MISARSSRMWWPSTLPRADPTRPIPTGGSAPRHPRRTGAARPPRGARPRGRSNRSASMNIVEIRVTLDHVEPTVTRTLQVPDAIRLDRLHMALQATMGWDDMHLYAFTAGGVTWGAPDPDIGGDDRPADKTTLAEAMADTGTHRFRYVYDFGDDWLHRLEIGPGTAPLPGTVYPRLTEVAGRCPPE